MFKLIVPVYKTTKQFKKGFRQMQEKMNEQYQQQQSQAQSTSAGSGTSKVPAGDYIDFEEVK